LNESEQEMTTLAETCSKPTPFTGLSEAQAMAEYRADGDRDDVVSHDPLAALESTFIEAYLRARGYTGQSLQAMPEEAARQLMVAASAYASARLAELEARARLVQELEGKAGKL
jgi:hypothetical protein